MDSMAYPTDAKEREKVRRQAQKDEGNEHVVKKKKVHVEEHYDDCGEDLSSLKGACLAVQPWTDAENFDVSENSEEEESQ